MGSTLCCTKNSNFYLANNYDDLIYIIQEDIDLLDKQIITKKHDKKVNNSNK